MTTLNEEDSRLLIESLKVCCSPDESRKRYVEARLAINRMMPGAEREDLCASPVACAVADTFLQIYVHGIPEHEMDEFWASVYKLESLTRESPLRKVKP